MGIFGGLNMKISEGTLIVSLNADDEVILIRPSGGGNYNNARSTVQNFVNELLGLFGAGSVSWVNLDKTGSDLADLATKSHTDLTDIGTYTHAQIDAMLDATSSKKIITFAPVESEFDLQVRNGTVAFSVPTIFNGFNLVDVLATVHTPASGSGTTQVQVRRRRAGTDADMLSTRISIAVSSYYATNAVIDTGNDDLATGDQIYIDIDQLPTTPPKGLSVSLTIDIP